MPSPVIPIRKIEMVFGDTFHIHGISLEFKEALDIWENDAHDEVLVCKLDVTGIEELGHEGAGSFGVVGLSVFVNKLFCKTGQTC